MFSAYQIMPHPNLKNEYPTLLKLTTKDDEKKEVKNKTEKQYYEKFLESAKFDNE